MTALRGSHTALYASPQQMRGEPPDPRDDVHALGVIWYQLLTGDLTTGVSADWREELTECGVPDGVIQVLGRCVTARAERRLANGDALAQELDALGSKAPSPSALVVPAEPPPLPPPVKDEDDLAGQMQRTLQQQQQVHTRARQLAETEQDYAAAVRELDQLPEHLRDAALHALLIQRRDRAAELDRLIREAVRAANFNGLRSLVKELLRLQPRRDDLRRLLSTLPEPPKRLINAIGMRLTLIPDGTFWMGSPDAEAERRANEGPVHEVRITRPFYLGIHPVTQALYQPLMGANPSYFYQGKRGGPEHPVEQVRWDEAVEFCRRLSDLAEERAAGRVYRLPTEAEWEYACRAGTTTPFWWGASASSAQANFDGRYPYGGAKKGQYLQRTTRVRSYPANPWGLFDLHGNVWEWCADWYAEDYYANSPIEDPKGPERGPGRVLRGGSWGSNGSDCRAAFRNRFGPGSRYHYLGFRAALTAPQDT
jgi:formylglycine-generating enzyme required for sulfatase activity